MNNRVKELRKAIGLSGEKFGEVLGVTRTAISLIETGKNNLTDQMFKSICREFHVSEEWLRDGTGEMFLPSETLSFDEILKNAEADKIEKAFFKAYFSLDKETRRKAIDSFKSHMISSVTD